MLPILALLPFLCISKKILCYQYLGPVADQNYVAFIVFIKETHGPQKISFWENLGEEN